MTRIEEPSSLGVGFAGLGSMGLGMAINLVKAGHAVAGFDPSEHARKNFEASGGSAVNSLAELCQGNSHYFIMVATNEQVDSVVFGGGGLVSHLPQHATICLCCTLPPTYVVDLPNRLKACGREDLRLLECPVSGGAIGALKGTLSIMMAGDEAIIDELRPELKAMAAPDRMFYCGTLGAASTLKMLNQHLAGTHVVAAAEILAFARSLGLSTRRTFDVVMASPASSWILGDRGKHMLDADWTAKSAIEIFLKDLGIVNCCADEVSFACPLASEAFYAFLKTAARGFGRRDDAFVVDNYEEVIQQSVAEKERQEPALQNGDGPAVRGFAPVADLVLSPKGGKLLQILNAKQQGDAIGLQITIFENGVDAIDQANKKLAALGTGSIVLVTELSDKEQVATFKKGIKDQHPQIEFVNGQIVPGQKDATVPQLLLSSDRPETVTCVQNSLPSSITSHRISDSFESATLMSLTIRYGSIIPVATAAESYGLAVAVGVAPALVYRLVAGAAGSSAQFNTQFPYMTSRDFDVSSQDAAGTWSEPSFQKTLADSKMLQALSRSLKFPATLLNAAHQMIKDASRGNTEHGNAVAAIVRRWDK